MEILTIHIFNDNRVINLRSLTLYGMLNENVLYLCTLQDTTSISAAMMMYNQIEQSHHQRQILLHTYRICRGTLRR